MFAAVDPMYMIMLMKNLGEGFVVWDKSASIRFRRPGRSDLDAVFIVTEEQLDSIREEVSSGRSTERSWEIELVDEEGNVCASVEKRIHISLKR